jgi:bifunctional non-homologous end joining protein LigD
VIIWDRGYYHHPFAGGESDNEQRLLDGLRKGDLKFILEGEKLHGEFALVKTGKDEKSWLLLKKKDRYTNVGDILTENRSVVSHKTLEEELEEVTQKPFRQKKVHQIRLHETMESDSLNDTPMAPMPHAVPPMLAATVKEPFNDPDWLFEVKWDGYRAMAEVRESGVSLYSRNGISFEKKFSPVVELLQKFDFEAVLDGEIVVVNDQGQPDFERLQNYGKSGSGHLIYYVFDLLYFQGHDLTGLPLLRRKELLKNILPSLPKIRFSEHVAQEGVLFFQAAAQKGLEGIIAKQAMSTYEAGKRSRTWLKIKSRLTQDGVIAGFTEPKGGRHHFGTLVLGVFQEGKLVYIGLSGGGFGAKELQEIREKLTPLIRKECPFDLEPETGTPTTWVKPQLVCEVGLTGWTGEEVMRHPVFLRLREDKSAYDVARDNISEGGSP